jgi:hypothetical protein
VRWEKQALAGSRRLLKQCLKTINCQLEQLLLMAYSSLIHAH